MPFQDAQLDSLAQSRDTARNLRDRAKAALDVAFARYDSIRSINGPRIDALKVEHDQLFAEANACSARSQNAFHARDHTNASYWSGQARMLRTRLPNIVAEKRRLVDEIQRARSVFENARDEYRKVKADHEKYRDAFTERLEQLKRESAQRRADREQEREQCQRDQQARRERVEQMRARLSQLAIQNFKNARIAQRDGESVVQHLDPQTRVMVRNGYSRDNDEYTTDVKVFDRDPRFRRHLHIVFGEDGRVNL